MAVNPKTLVQKFVVCAICSAQHGLDLRVARHPVAGVLLQATAPEEVAPVSLHLASLEVTILWVCRKKCEAKFMKAFKPQDPTGSSAAR